MTSTLRLAVASASDVGRKRAQNEDRVLVAVPDDAADRARHGVLLLVCDGMGGARAGEVASALAAETIEREWSAAPGADRAAELVAAVERANAAVHEESLRDSELGGMGTTCTALAVVGREVFVAHVGDSRAYLLRGGRLVALTSDHSLVAQLVRDGLLTADQARTDPRRNVVTRSVGVSANVDVDGGRAPLDLEPGDTLLVCSDGLHGVVEEPDLARLAAGPDLDAACRAAIALANERGGPDNISIALARLEPL